MGEVLGKLVGMLMVLSMGLVGGGLYVAPGWMAAQLVAMFGVPPPDDRSLLPRLKAVVMEALVQARAPCSGVHRIESPRQADYEVTLTAVCMNGASYAVRFKPSGEIMLSPNR